jgi:hypothetical protein
MNTDETRQRGLHTGATRAALRADSDVAALAEALTLAGASAAFRDQAGELHLWGVPAWVVSAYAATRLAGGTPASGMARRLAAAHLGADVVARFGDADDGWAGWALGRAWAVRLGAIERALRDVPARAA